MVTPEVGQRLRPDRACLFKTFDQNGRTRFRTKKRPGMAEFIRTCSVALKLAIAFSLSGNDTSM
jgi:hypothetical protein